MHYGNSKRSSIFSIQPVLPEKFSERKSREYFSIFFKTSERVTKYFLELFCKTKIFSILVRGLCLTYQAGRWYLLLYDTLNFHTNVRSIQNLFQTDNKRNKMYKHLLVMPHKFKRIRSYTQFPSWLCDRLFVIQINYEVKWSVRGPVF